MQPCYFFRFVLYCASGVLFTDLCLYLMMLLVFMFCHVFFFWSVLSQL
jgi:hypothetical protein